MTEIDYIYHNATSTAYHYEDSVLTETIITYTKTSTFIPFFDYYLVFSAFSFTLLFLWFMYYIIYKKNDIIRWRTRIFKRKY